MKLVYLGKEWELAGSLTLGQALEQAGLRIENLIAVRDGKILKEDTVLDADDRVDLMDIMGGG
jgi:sulfur carrier protein ThiS